MAIDKGAWVRKKNFDFFKNFYISGKAEYVPALFITTIKSCHSGKVTINGEAYDLENLVEITEEEANKLCREYLEMKLSEPNPFDLTNTHIRRDTNEPKKGQTKGAALRLVFTYNHKNPEANLQAYNCPECGEVHVGRAPRTLAELSKLSLEQLEEEIGVDKAKLVVDQVLKIKNCERHAFARSMNETLRSRKCANCGMPENEINAIVALNTQWQMADFSHRGIFGAKAPNNGSENEAVLQ